MHGLVDLCRSGVTVPARDMAGRRDPFGASHGVGEQYVDSAPALRAPEQNREARLSGGTDRQPRHCDGRISADPREDHTHRQRTDAHGARYGADGGRRPLHECHHREKRHGPPRTTQGHSCVRDHDQTQYGEHRLPQQGA